MRRRITNREIQQIYQTPGINIYLIRKLIIVAGHVWRSNIILEKVQKGEMNGKRYWRHSR